MPELRKMAPLSCGEELRRRVAARRRRRRLLLHAGFIIGISIPLLASAAWRPQVRLVWNASASAPEGLYWIAPDLPARSGDTVIAWAPEPARSLAARRHYLPSNVPLVKRVAAAAGDEVCASGKALFVNGRPVALRSKRDPSGRPMPWWSGCRTIQRGELFLLNPAVAQAFDGRYFGVTPADHVVGTARLLWRR